MLPCPLQSVNCQSRLITADGNSIVQRLLAGRSFRHRDYLIFLPINNHSRLEINRCNNNYAGESHCVDLNS